MRASVAFIAGVLGLGLFAESFGETSTPAPVTHTPSKVPESIAKTVGLEIVTKEVPAALYLTSPPGDERLFIVSKQGKIFILQGGKIDKKKPFLNVASKISSGYEQGLLGLAFHPNYAKNGLLYVHLTDPKGLTRVVEYQVSKDDPNAVDLKTERTLLIQEGRPYAGHNAALPVFGPDGKLYIATGDGGEGNKPGTGQSTKDFFGKLLRIDVDNKEAKLETIGLGLRNPWRYSFDRETGDLYIADVGHNKYEELNFLPVWNLTDHNFGWSLIEGNGHCYKKKNCDLAGFTPPIFEYDHKTGCSITGGYVYRGKALPELQGMYFYADFCTGALRSFRYKDNKLEDHWDWKPTLDEDDQFASLVSFGEDKDGELYLISLDGVIYKFVRK